MKTIFALLLATAMSAGAWAQTATTTTPGDDQSAKQDMKDAGHATKTAAKKTGQATETAAKKTGHAVKKTTKKVVHKGAHETKEGASKVEDKTTPQ